MKRYAKLLALVAVFGIVAAACGGNKSPQSNQTNNPSVKKGGTLRMAQESDVNYAFDPAKEYYNVTWAYYRCCLLRTLMTYNGLDTVHEGTKLFPDLADGEPTVSDDKLTWTFKLKSGIHYGPPFQDTEVVAGDIIRALEREANDVASAHGYSFYYSEIEGFDDSDGKPGSISGLSAPDDQTLQIKLTEPVGDLGYRFAMGATAPIPKGASEGHDQDYGRFLVATGPYMFEGSDKLDFTKPAKDQKPVSGYDPGKSIVMVRNPSYDPDTDGLRPAYVDRIEVTIGTTSEDAANKIDNGDIDMDYDGVPPAQQVRKYQTTPDLKDQIHSNYSDAVRYISMNLATPPFDDIHVRKALNYATDKDGLRRLRGGPLFGDIAGHAIVDSLENNQLKSYDPYASPNGQGDIAKAQEEMKLSKYDKNKDGKCDESPECKNVLTIADEGSPYPKQTALLQDNYAQLGITLDVKAGERTEFMYTKCNTPADHAALCPSVAWGKDYSDALTFGPPLFGSESIGPAACCNYALVGASADFLQKAGYTVTEVPSVDADMDECKPLVDDERITCWANVDKKIMEEIVPWVPYLFDKNVDITSSRLVNYTFDQFSGDMSVDHVGISES